MVFFKGAFLGLFFSRLSSSMWSFDEISLQALARRAKRSKRKRKNLKKSRVCLSLLECLRDSLVFQLVP